MKKIILFIMLFILNITVFAEGEATIQNIRVNGREVSCIGYECKIEVDSKSALITFDKTDPNATVDRNSGFSVDLTSQVTSIKIIVSNTIGEEKNENTYNISIALYEKSDDYTLSSLSVNEDKIDLLEDVYVYSYQSDYSDEKIVISATPNDKNAKVLTEKEYDFPLDRSSLAIDFDVKAENDETKTYRIVVNRGVKPDTFLKSLKIDKVKFDFKKETLNYALTVDYSVNELLIEAIPSSEKATVDIKKDTLVVGENEITITVTNDKATSEYKLLVTREPNMDKSLANLSSLEIEEYPKLSFEENVLEYDIKLKKIPESLTIKAKSKSSDGKVEIVGNEELVDGSKITIKNTLIETGITREYTLKIIENKSFSDNKSFILISIIILLIAIVVLAILEIKDRKIKRKRKLTKILELKKKKKKKEEKEDIEII